MTIHIIPFYEPVRGRPIIELRVIRKDRERVSSSITNFIIAAMEKYTKHWIGVDTR